MNPKPNIIKVIDAIRNSNKDSTYLYKNGECYSFALILRSIFDGELYYSDIEGHVWFKYKNRFYDIDGMLYKIPNDIHLLNHKEGHKPHSWNRRNNSF